MEDHLTALEGVTDNVSTYLAGRLRHKLFNFPNDYPTKSMSEALVTHCERAISVIAEAWTNPLIVVNWEVDDYIGVIGKQLTGMYHLFNGQKANEPPIAGTCILIESAISEKFPPAFPEYLDVIEGSPTRIDDRMSHILGWYLPGIISDELQVVPPVPAKSHH